MCAGKYNFKIANRIHALVRIRIYLVLYTVTKILVPPAGPFHQPRPPSPPLSSTHQTENHMMEKIIKLWRDEKACIETREDQEAALA